MENDINQILTIYVNTIESLIEYITVNSICEHLSPENVKNIENVLLIIYKQTHYDLIQQIKVLQSKLYDQQLIVY